MARHRRGRSLSEALTLEQSEEGGLVISSISNASRDQGLKEGDEILGATINFEQLSKEDVLKVLKLMEPFDDKIQVLTRSSLSKSLSNLDESGRSPEEMLKESYSKLYNAKIKRFMKDDPSGADEGCVDGKVTTEPTSSTVSLKHDAKLPRLGVDFGLLKSRNLSTDGDCDSQSDARELTDSNLNLPPLGLSSNGFTLPGAEAPRQKLGERNMELKVSDFNQSGTFPDNPNGNAASGMNLPNTDCAPEMGLDLKDSDVNTPEMEMDLNGENITGPSFNPGVPKVDIKGINPDFNMPKFKVPRLSLSGPPIGIPECEVRAPEIETPKITSGKQSRRHKKPDLNVDDLSSFVGRSTFKLSGKLPEKPGFDLNGANTDMALGNVKVPLKKPKTDLKSPALYVDDPPGSLTCINDVETPELSLKTPKIKSGTSSDLNLAKPDLKGRHFKINTPSANAKGQSGKYKAPKFTMPKFDIGPRTLDLGTPDLDLSGPNLSGGINAPSINMPKFDHKTPKLDLNAPDVGLDMPSGKVKMPELHAPDWDLKAPSGKLKMPKLNLSGTSPKGPNLDLNADMDSPNLRLKAPKIKGGVDAPDLNMPNMKLKDPKLDVSPPDLNIGSPKTKMKFPKLKLPKFGLPNIKGPEIDGSLDGPDIAVNAPDVNFKAPKTDVDLSGPSGKFKKPNLNLPDMKFSGPKLDGPNLDLGTPDLDLSGPNLSGGINAPSINMPKFDHKTPKLDLNAPDVGLDMPSGKVKMPELHAPDWDLKAPSGKLKMPKLNLSGTSPKGPNLDLNADMDSPNLRLKAPKIKGGVDAPDLNMPNMKLKDPKLDLSPPDLNIGSEKAKLKMPKINLPSAKGRATIGNVDGPDIGVPRMNLKSSKPGFVVPDVDFGNPSGAKFKMPNLKIPDVGLSAPQVDDPDLDLNSQNLYTKLPKGSNFKINADLEASDMNLKLPKTMLGSPNADPKLNSNTPDVSISFPDANFKKPIKPGELKGNVTNLNVSAPNINVKQPKTATPNPQMQLRSPQLHADDPSDKLKKPSYKNRRSDMTSKKPDLDIDQDFKLHHADRKPPKTKVRSSYPAGDDASRQHIDLSRFDLNIDDFTGKDHVLRARGSTLDLRAPQSGQVTPPSGVGGDKMDSKKTRAQPNIDLPTLSQDSQIRVPDSSDEYLITVFPNQTQNTKIPNRKFNTPGRLNFHPGNLDLEVPCENDMKGSTFFFSNLV